MEYTFLRWCAFSAITILLHTQVQYSSGCLCVSMVVCYHRGKNRGPSLAILRRLRPRPYFSVTKKVPSVWVEVASDRLTQWLLVGVQKLQPYPLIDWLTHYRHTHPPTHRHDRPIIATNTTQGLTRRILTQSRHTQRERMRENVMDGYGAMTELSTVR